MVIQEAAPVLQFATFQKRGGMSGNGWTGSHSTGPLCPQIPPGSSPPPCPPPPSFPTATQAQLKPLHHSTPAAMAGASANTPAPLHQSTPAPAGGAPGSQHQRSTSRTPVPSPFLEPQQPQQRAGSNSNQWGQPPQQPTAAQVVGFPGNESCDNFLAACC